MIFFILVGAVVGGLMVIFILQNAVPITVLFLSWQIHGSLAVVLLLATLAGIIMALLATLPGLIRDEWRYGQLKADKARLEQELAAARKAVTDVAAGRASVVEQTTTTTTVAPEPLY